jgi:hypothetical protein
MELVRTGTLAKLPMRVIRIPRWSVEAVEEGHNGADGRARSGRDHGAPGRSAPGGPDDGERQASLPDDPEDAGPEAPAPISRKARLGHSTDDMADHYAKASERQDREAVERLAEAVR